MVILVGYIDKSMANEVYHRYDFIYQLISRICAIRVMRMPAYVNVYEIK